MSDPGSRSARRDVDALAYNYGVASPTSNRLPLVPGLSADFVVDLVDPSTGERVLPRLLVGASATLLVRVDPLGSDVLNFQTTDPTHLVIDVRRSALDVHFAVTDTSTLTAGSPYFWQVELTTCDGEVKTPIPWTPVDVTPGGSAATPPPPFASTVSITADYPLSRAMRYQTPGGSPIINAQVRVYRKSDYIVGNLASPVGITTTNAYGDWVDPVLVSPGYTYVARLEKPYEFGPDVVEFFA